jgi:hypothetical protein
MRKALVIVGAALTVLIGSPAIGGTSSTEYPASGRPATSGVEPAKRFVSTTASRTEKPAFSRNDSFPDGIAGGYVFVPINPYRTFDSRQYQNGFQFGGHEVYFDVITNTNGVQQIPSDAVAVTYNLAVDNTTGSGFLSVYPADINWPGNASINWTTTGTTLSNGGTVAIGFLDAPGQIAVYVGPELLIGTDYVIDITGYYI